MMKDKKGNTLPCEMKAGCKHQNNPEFRRHCQEWLLDYTRSHGLTVEDNLQIEDQRKQERYAQRNETIRAILLETASRSSSFTDLAAKLKAEQDIQLVRRGQTWSILLPGAKKRRRLKMLDLSEDLLRQAMGMKPEPPRQTDVEFEKKQYIEWLRHCRARNAARADDAIANAADLIAGRVRKSGRSYNPWEFRELNDLLKQTTYLQRDLQTELDKENRLLERWDRYRDPSDEEKGSHESYLRWCGCDPNSEAEYRRLTEDISVTELQIREADALRDALVETAEDWQDQDRQRVFFFRQSGTLSRQDQLKQQLKAVRANRKKLEQIAFHCEEAAHRRIYKTEYLRKAAYFREQWHQKLQQEDALKARLRELREEERAKKRQAKLKEQGP